jgi:hypothetical protein
MLACCRHLQPLRSSPNMRARACYLHPDLQCCFFHVMLHWLITFMRGQLQHPSNDLQSSLAVCILLSKVLPVTFSASCFACPVIQIFYPACPAYFWARGACSACCSSLEGPDSNIGEPIFPCMTRDMLEVMVL